MAYKKERLEKIIEREVSLIIMREVKDDRLDFVTITKVNVSADYSFANIYYTIYKEDKALEESKEALLEAKGFIKSSLSKKLQIRKIPELIFKYDSSYEEGNKIEEILRSIKK